MDSQFAAILGELGLGILSNSLYDALKTLVSQQASKEDCIKAIQDCIDVHGVSMRAETVILALAEHDLQVAWLYMQLPLLLSVLG